MIDIGANLAHDSFDDDRQQVMERATNADVTGLIITGSDLGSSHKAIALAREHPGQCFATAGLHPHHAQDWNGALADLISQAASENNIVAIGETGLDYFRDFSPRAAQRQAFADHLALAIDHKLPVFLHQRDAHDDFIAMLREHLPELTGAVVHCFTEGRDTLDDYLSEDLYIGITGWICDERRGGELYDAAPAIPDNRLMIETDCPYLLPRTIRPKPKTRRNEPAYLPWVCEQVTKARDQSQAHVARITHDNTERFFNIRTSVDSPS